MAAERDERLYLADMRDAVDKILRYTKGGRATFFADPMVQDAVIRNLEVMGEAVRQVSATTRSAHPDIPWRQIAGTRDRVIRRALRAGANMPNSPPRRTIVVRLERTLHPRQ